MGTGGDDLLNVDPSYAADRLAALDLGGLWRFCRACQRTSPFPAARVARGVFWDYALAPELARLGRRVLGAREPARAPRGCAAAAARRALPAVGIPERRRSRRPSSRGGASARVADPVAPGEGSYVATLRRITQSPLVLVERDQSHAWAQPSRLHVPVPVLRPRPRRALAAHSAGGADRGRPAQGPAAALDRRATADGRSAVEEGRLHPGRARRAEARRPAASGGARAEA